MHHTILPYVSQSVDYPIRFLVWDITAAPHPPRNVAGQVQRAIEILLQHNLPHNLVLTAKKVFLLPRRRVVHRLGHLNPGFPEVAGALICSRESDFESFSEPTVLEHFRELTVPFHLIESLLKSLMSSSMAFS